MERKGQEPQLHCLLACGLGQLPSELQFLHLWYSKVVRIQWNNLAKVWEHSRNTRNLFFPSNEGSRLQLKSYITKDVCCAVLSCFSCVWLFVTLWPITHQALLSMGLSRQKYWSGLPCPPPGDLPNPGSEPEPLRSPALASGFFTTSTTWEALEKHIVSLFMYFLGQCRL